MKIGVVCEGETDFIAISHFLSGFMESKGVDVQIVALQPDMDNTRRYAGWSTLLNWLIANPPERRALRYFGRALFAGPGDVKRCDVILIQMDTDILGEPSFVRFVEKTFSFSPSNPTSPSDRATEIRKLLEIAAGIQVATIEMSRKYVLCPAVESTETWCVAVRNAHDGDPEALQGSALFTAFMIALVESEGQTPSQHYEKCDKNQRRRAEFCMRHRSAAQLIHDRCDHFRIVADQLHSLASPQQA